MQGICKLCKQEAKLEISHLIPRFVGKWTKKTSITGFFRESNDVNKRSQDLAKEHWLCSSCEDLFSKWETHFANKIFYPFVDDNKCRATYDDWLAKFCASLSWRTLTFIRSKNTTETHTEEYIKNLDSAEIHLANFLLGKVDNLNQYEQHIFPLERIESATAAGLPPNINRYFLRIIAMDICGNSKNTFIYTKIPSFIFLGLVKSENSKAMRTSRVALTSGEISPRQYQWPDGFIDYIRDKCNEISNLSKSIKPEHQEKIEQFILENPDRTVNSKQFEAFLHDHKMFGKDVFS